MIYWLGFAVACWAIADFISGLGHWWEDRYARESWPLIGPLIATPNQEHHARPLGMATGYWARNTVAIAPAMVVGMLIAVACGPSPWLLILAMVSQSNEIHYWTHHRQGWIVRALQATGIIQPPRMHGEHHKAPFDCRYCVMTAWLNPILDAVSFWTRLETFIAVTTGARPCR